LRLRQIEAIPTGTQEEEVMTRRPSRFLTALFALCLAALPLAAADVQLAVVQFPERSGVDLKMGATTRVVPAEAEAEVKFKDGQADVEVDAKKLPPAILFGGDATSYVVWAVSRDGNAENLGELIVKGTSAEGHYRTGQKEFALLVTAEPYNLVLMPSELVCFTSAPPPAKKARSTPVTYSAFAPAPRTGNAQIGAMRYAGSEPVELVQAQNVLDQARAMGAEKYAPDSVRDAGIALAQASNSFKAGNDKVGVDYARRSLSMSSTAIRDTQKNLAAQAAAEAAARRAAEMQSLEQQRSAAQAQAATAEKDALAAREQAVAAREQALAAQQQLDQARQQAAAAQQQMASLQEQAAAAQQDAAAAQQRAAAAGLSAEAAEAARRDADASRQKAEELATQATAARAEADRTTQEVATVAARLEQQNAQLQKENDRLIKERDDLAGQLDSALSSVAQITKTARGVVVNLPDILFDINKATLKQNTQVALAKLAGIVQVFPKINLRIEGYTDSTGSDELNMRLSKDRAEAVLGFLKSQGVAASRMTAVGYGPKFPVADNATVEGRAKNRRVEIILAEGQIQGAGN
jgi:outer membrane protein OmpA-like peptidoglycan-associated protein